MVVPNLPSSYHSPVSKLAKALAKHVNKENVTPPRMHHWHMSDLRAAVRKALSPTARIGKFTFTNTEWLESSFQKRECIKIIPSTRDSNRCCCGLPVVQHSIPLFVPVMSSPEGQESEPIAAQVDPTVQPNEHWNPNKHTAAFPTDAYGCIDFRGSGQTNKAQYIRLSYDTPPETVLTLLLREWGLEKPKLLITVTGGKANFELQPRLKRSLRKGLLKAAKTTGAWIFTGGVNAGVTKHVGDALVTEKSPRIKGGRVVSIGITPWGIVDKRQDLVGKKRDIPLHSGVQPKSRFLSLNKHHAYFLLVDNGTVGRYGAEIALRRKLEKYISTQRLSANFSTPLVCLVIEGGTNTIRAVLEYVTDTPPVPVVVCDGTGRAADLIAFAHKWTLENGESGPLNEMREQLLLTIQKTFNVSLELAERLQLELMQCVKRKNLITVYRWGEHPGEAELDQVIMTALFKAQHLTPTEQLSLALTWNRCDIARKEIFREGQDWPPGALDRAMQEALENDRVDFVRLLLENGVNMNKFLTISRLETLYNSRKGPANTLEYLVRDVVPKMPKHYQYTLIDVGLVLNQLMGSGYRSTYSRRKFKVRYELAKSQTTGSPLKMKTVNNFLNKSLQKANTDSSFKIPTFVLPQSDSGADTPMTHNTNPYIDFNAETFDYPFSELLVWAVLTKRKEMAKLMWQHGEQAMSKALVASRLCQAMAAEAADDDLDVEIFDELTNFGKDFETLAVELLDHCYQLDDDLTQHLLTASLENWSRKTCLSLAIIARNLSFLAHPISQAILADLWMGGLRMRKNPAFKIILGLLFPPSITKLEFKTREELELMPQTEEELQERDESNSTSSASTSRNSSRRSSIVNHHGGHGFFTSGVDSESEEVIGSGVRTRMRSDRSDNEGDLNRMSIGHVNLGEGVPFSFQDTFQDDSYTNPLYRMDTSQMKKKTRPLKLKMKLYEFYAAPITKYYCHSIAYIVFLLLYTYICLVKTPPEPSWPESYVVACMLCFGCEKVRTFVTTESSDFHSKFKVWVLNTRWNIFDSIAIIMFLFAFSLRFELRMIPYTHAIYSTCVCYWYVRSLKLIGVNKYFGPYVMMIGKMIENMIYFVVLLLVVLMAFGVSRQSILFPNEDWHWRLVRHIFYQPYFMLYGEVFAPDIDPDCDPDCTEYDFCDKAPDGSLKVPCHTGRWVTPIIMTIYLLVANILLINLLIASFNTIYNKVSAMSHQLFNFQRFSIVMEYEEKPIMPPPFTVLSHLHLLGKYIYRTMKGTNKRFESGLKLVLSKFDMERLYDFEEEGVEGYLRAKEEEKQQNVEGRLRALVELSEELRTKFSDFERWERETEQSTRGIDYRMQRLEEIAEQTSSQLSVIHRFMATTIEVPPESSSKGSRTGSTAGIPRRFPSETAQMDMRGIVSRSTSIMKHSEGQREEEDSHSDEGHLPLGPESDSDHLEYVEDFHRELLEDKARAVEDEELHVAPVDTQSKEYKSSPILSPAESKSTLKKSKKSGNSKKRVRHLKYQIGDSTDEEQVPTYSKTLPDVTTNVEYHDMPVATGVDEDGRPIQPVEDVTSAPAALQIQAVVAEHVEDELAAMELQERDEKIEEMQMKGISSRNHKRMPSGSASGHSQMPSRFITTEPQRTSIAEESDENSSLKFNRGLSLKSRRRIASNRDYTSITDELESLIAAPAPETDPPQPPPFIKIESEALRDAEETDFIMMESLIKRRLRRDSTNLHNSLDDLVASGLYQTMLSVESIRDEDESDKEERDNQGASALDLRRQRSVPPDIPRQRFELMESPGGKDESNILSVSLPPNLSDKDDSINSRPLLPSENQPQTTEEEELSSAIREGSFRIRLNETADNVEIEYIDENKK